MKLGNILSYLEQIAPPSYQENYDNAGLIVGNKDEEIRGITCCLDVTEAVIAEAIAAGHNLIVAHHPIIFKGIKRLNDKNYVERCIRQAIKHDVCIYAMHTNLDNVLEKGVNQKIASKLGLDNTTILKPMANSLVKLQTYCPLDYTAKISEALWAAGAGGIGNYKECAFFTTGTGTYMPSEGSNPFEGKKGIRSSVEENKIEFILESHKIDQVMRALKQAHPYEEVAYELLKLENVDTTKGAGCVGYLPQPMPVAAFLEHVKTSMQVNVIKHTAFHREEVQKIAVCGGSGSFLLADAIQAQADVFISADFKYHEYFDADKRITVCDIGHYESEIFTLEIFVELLTEKFPTFATRSTKISTNPVNYHY
jgi:dinuclear metal center YbgI/SA1388 family protein